MIMADILAPVFVVLGLIAACPGLWLLCRALWPGTVESATTDIKATLWKPFLVGIPITATAVISAALLSKLPQPAGGISFIAVLSLFIIYSSSGVSGLAAVATIGLAEGDTVLDLVLSVEV